MATSSFDAEFKVTDPKVIAMLERDGVIGNKAEHRSIDVTSPTYQPSNTNLDRPKHRALPHINIMAHAMGIAARQFPLSRNNNWLWFVSEYIKRGVSR